MPWWDDSLFKDGMSSASRKRYLFAVERLIKHYWCSPAELTEQQVYDYLLQRHLAQSRSRCV
jgi:hypothetical protein